MTNSGGTGQASSVRGISPNLSGEMSGLDEDQARKFAHLRRQTVHTLPYLVHDRPVVGGGGRRSDVGPQNGVTAGAAAAVGVTPGVRRTGPAGG